jgi:hypothetical protein
VTRPWLTQEVRDAHDEWGNAAHLLAERDRERLDTGDWRRASGDTLCEGCDRTYYDHANVVGALWLHRLCDDTLVKL